MTTDIERRTKPVGPASGVLVSVISMANAQSRRSQMAEQLNQTGLSWEFFDARTDADPRLRLQTTKWRRINGRTLNRAEIGCYSSHFALLAEHAERPAGNVLIVLEDDALLDTDFLSDQATLMGLAQEFGYVRLNAQYLAPSKPLKDIGRRRIVEFKRKVHGTLGYLIDTVTAKRFCDSLRDLVRPIDIEMDRSWAHGIPIRCIHQYVAIERTAASQIGGRDFERLGFNDFVGWKFFNQIEKIRAWTGL